MDSEMKDYLIREYKIIESEAVKAQNYKLATQIRKKIQLIKNGK
jgi:hypothetical protein